MNLRILKIKIYLTLYRLPVIPMIFLENLNSYYFGYFSLKYHSFILSLTIKLNLRLIDQPHRIDAKSF